MSEEEWVDTDGDDNESEDKGRPDKKALPWHSLDLVKKGDTSSDDSDDGLPSDSSTKKKIFSNDEVRDKVIASVPSTSLELDKIRIPSEDVTSPQNSDELVIQKETIPENAWNDVELKGPPTEINILLLGESGVGKSTFINSFANYMKHANFEAVQENALSVLIPARFNIFDKNFKKHVIEIGANDKNEHLVDGAAATQDVKTYVFYIHLNNNYYMIRLIDTPGMGDPRGIDQDNKNCDHVLNYIGRLEKIHAICLLLKPTNTRLDVFLNYCVTQILSRLEKSATDNIAFLFTNTRGQNYTPGDTYTSLELLVKKIKDSNNVTLPLSHENVFCFDNEAFRFLAAIKQNVMFKDGILEANIESWKYSYKEVYRVLSYIVKLRPHDPQKTISINHARKMVIQLSQPLAEIVQLIGDNIYQLDQHTDQLLMENQTLDELKQKIYMPVIDIIAKELTHPVTVCTAPQCSTIYKVADKNKYHYKQRCHNPCRLNNVSREIIGDPALLSCTAMHGTENCQECGCRFNTHMHIYYETDTFQNNIVDENVQKNITSKEDATREKEALINKILNHKEQLEKEHKHIIKCSAAFANFLQQNAITPINDSLKEYVKYLITREENLGAQADRSTMVYLRRLLTEYEQEKHVLEEALKQNTSGIVNSSPNVIENKVRELFTLPNFGKKIKEFYDLHQRGGQVEHKQSEHIVQERYILNSIVDKCKSYGNAVIGAIGFGPTKKDRLELERQKALTYEREYYNAQLLRRDWNAGRPYQSRQHENSGRSPYNDYELHYGWPAEEYLLPTEKQYLRRQYELEYNYRDMDRKASFHSHQQYFEQVSSAAGDDRYSGKKYFGNSSASDNNPRNGNREGAANYNDTSSGEQNKFNGANESKITKPQGFLGKVLTNRNKGSRAANTKELSNDASVTDVAKVGKIHSTKVPTGGKNNNKKKNKKNKKK